VLLGEREALASDKVDVANRSITEKITEWTKDYIYRRRTVLPYISAKYKPTRQSIQSVASLAGRKRKAESEERT